MINLIEIENKRRRILDGIVSAYFVIGVLLFIISNKIYENTFIESYLMFIIPIVPSIALSLLLRKIMNRIERKNIPLIFHGILHSCSTGSVILLVFLSMNYYIPIETKGKETLPIIEFARLSGSKGDRHNGQPYALVLRNGILKQIHIHENEFLIMNGTESITINVSKGILGYDVLTSYNINFK